MQKGGKTFAATLFLEWTNNEKTNIETNIRLSALEVSEANKAKDIEDMKNNQKKFFKIFYIATGVGLSLGLVGSVLSFVLDLYSKIPK